MAVVVVEGFVIELLSRWDGHAIGDEPADALGLFDAHFQFAQPGEHARLPHVHREVGGTPPARFARPLQGDCDLVVDTLAGGMRASPM